MCVCACECLLFWGLKGSQRRQEKNKEIRFLEWRKIPPSMKFNESFLHRTKGREARSEKMEKHPESFYGNLCWRRRWFPRKIQLNSLLNCFTFHTSTKPGPGPSDPEESSLRKQLNDDQTAIGLMLHTQIAIKSFLIPPKTLLTEFKFILSTSDNPSLCALLFCVLP